MTELLEITINMHFGKYNPGNVLTVKSNNGIPVDQYWRKKLATAKRNNCISAKIVGIPLEKEVIPLKNDDVKVPKKRTRNSSKENLEELKND